MSWFRGVVVWDMRKPDGFAISPDGQWVAYWTYDSDGVVFGFASSDFERKKATYDIWHVSVDGARFLDGFQVRREA